VPTFAKVKKAMICNGLAAFYTPQPRMARLTID